MNALDGEETARRLIESGSGTITPYGVVYDNGMKLEQIYDDPWSYADLILNGDPEIYLKTVTGYKPIDN